MNTLSEYIFSDLWIETDNGKHTANVLVALHLSHHWTGQAIIWSNNRKLATAAPDNGRWIANGPAAEGLSLGEITALHLRDRLLRWTRGERGDRGERSFTGPIISAHDWARGVLNAIYEDARVHRTGRYGSAGFDINSRAVKDAAKDPLLIDYFLHEIIRSSPPVADVSRLRAVIAQLESIIN